jgi:hypothetical protein
MFLQSFSDIHVCPSPFEHAQVAFMPPALRKKYEEKLKNIFLVLFYLFGRCQGQQTGRTLKPSTSRPTTRNPITRKPATSTPTNTNQPTTRQPTTGGPTTAKPTVQPTSSPSSSMQPSGLPSIAPSQFKCMTFAAEPAINLVNNTFIYPDGGVEFQNVVASNHACFLLFSNSNQMGKHKVTNEHLFPQEGIIMSSGKPEDFCWNDSEEMNTQWDSPGDADLTSLAYQDYPQGETFDAVSFPRIIFL